MIENYRDLTLEKYYELQDIERDGNDIDVLVKIMSVLSDMDEDAILVLPLTEFNKMAKKVDFLKEKPKPMKRIPSTVNINGKKYNILKDATEMTAGQYIDYKELAKDYDSIEKNLTLLLAIFIIPEGKTYGNGYDIYELSETIKKHLSFELAISISNFFFRQSQTYSNNILIYLEWTLRKMMRKEKNPEIKKELMMAIKESRNLKNSLKNGYGLTGV